MATERDEAFFNRVGNDRISSRQIDELIGIARGIAADGAINRTEVEFFEKWLAANLHISDQPLIRDLYDRCAAILSDTMVDADESRELLDTLQALATNDFEVGEVLKTTTLPFCDPPPRIIFPDRVFCFTGTFAHGQRKHCETAVTDRGGSFGAITKSTDYLIVGAYATDSWKHSSFGNKILKACDYRDNGVRIAIVSEAHWSKYL